MLWFFIVLMGLAGSLFLLSLFWERYTSNPTRTSVLTNYASTLAVPFPAITICNINKVLISKVEAFVRKLDLKGIDEEYVNELLPRILLAYSDSKEYNTTELKLLNDLLEDNDFGNVRSIWKRVSQNCREMLVKCKWEGKEFDCREHFVDTFTPSGRCCSFNYNPRSKVENTTFFFGHQMGLTVLLDPMLQEKQYSSLYSRGMKVVFHHPRNYPGTANIEKILAVGRETFLQVDGTRYICSDDVRHLTPVQRKCVYFDEHPLRYFPEYRGPNCITECLADHYSKACRCVPYFFTFSDKPACNITKIPCLVRARKFRNNTLFNCNCPMQCEDIFYDVLSTSTELVNQEYSISSFLKDVNITKNSMLLHVFFATQTQTILLRGSLTSTIYLLSSFGGIFSLYLGCSFISGVEIIYYVCIRFAINLKMNNKVEAKRHANKPTKLLMNKQVPRRSEVWRRSSSDGIYTIYNRNVFLN